jgi:hypothetical protein
MPVNDWWAIVMGSGLRRVAIELGQSIDELRVDNEQWIRDHGVASIVVDANYALAYKDE